MVDAFALIEVSKLKEHEEIISKRFKELKNEILSDGFLREPIIVDRNTNIILDGHHRFNIIRSLGYSKIPVQYVNYADPKIIVDSWNGSEKQTKENVVEKVSKGEKFPPKTTRHIIPNRIKEIVYLSRLR